MIRGVTLNKIRMFTVLEPEGDVFHKSALVSFDSEMIMCLTLRYQVLRDLTLGQ